MLKDIDNPTIIPYLFFFIEKELDCKKNLHYVVFL